MILDLMDPSLIFDDIPREGNENNVYFLTHPSELFTLEKEINCRSVIYTSTHIAKIITKNNLLIQKYLKILKPNESKGIVLENGVQVTVTMFEMSDFTRKVIYYVEGRNMKILYLGSSSAIDALIFNKKFLRCLQKGIDYLFVDNTRMRSQTYSSAEDVAEKINNLFKRYPYHQITLIIPRYGYENLIILLMEKYKKKVYLKYQSVFETFDLESKFVTDPSEADIVISSDVTFSLNMIYKRFITLKKLTVRVLEGYKDIKNLNFPKNGLYQFQWYPSPSLFDIYSILKLTRPCFVREIYELEPKIPDKFKMFCRGENPEEQNEFLEGGYGSIDTIERESGIEKFFSLESTQPFCSQNDEQQNFSRRNEKIAAKSPIFEISNDRKITTGNDKQRDLCRSKDNTKNTKNTKMVVPPPHIPKRRPLKYKEIKPSVAIVKPYSQEKRRCSPVKNN